MLDNTMFYIQAPVVIILEDAKDILAGMRELQHNRHNLTKDTFVVLSKETS